MQQIKNGYLSFQLLLLPPKIKFNKRCLKEVQTLANSDRQYAIIRLPEKFNNIKSIFETWHTIYGSEHKADIDQFHDTSFKLPNKNKLEVCKRAHRFVVLLWRYIGYFACTIRGKDWNVDSFYEGNVFCPKPSLCCQFTGINGKPMYYNKFWQQTAWKCLEGGDAPLRLKGTYWTHSI